MNPRITTLNQKLLVGTSMAMSIINNLTGQLWGQLMPRLGEINSKVGHDKYSLQVYPTDYYQQFDPSREFTKWAAVEVHHAKHIPEGMNAFELPGGLYAVFDYKGSSADPGIFQYIYSEWLPQSSYQLDDRPHFEVLGEKYKNNDPESEEEIWIPIK